MSQFRSLEVLGFGDIWLVSTNTCNRLTISGLLALSHTAVIRAPKAWMFYDGIQEEATDPRFRFYTIESCVSAINGYDLVLILYKVVEPNTPCFQEDVFEDDWSEIFYASNSYESVSSTTHHEGTDKHASQEKPKMKQHADTSESNNELTQEEMAE